MYKRQGLVIRERQTIPFGKPVWSTAGNVLAGDRVTFRDSVPGLPSTIMVREQRYDEAQDRMVLVTAGGLEYYAWRTTAVIIYRPRVAL